MYTRSIVETRDALFVFVVCVVLLRIVVLLGGGSNYARVMEGGWRVGVCLFVKRRKWRPNWATCRSVLYDRLLRRLFSSLTSCTLWVTRNLFE